MWFLPVVCGFIPFETLNKFYCFLFFTKKCIFLHFFDVFTSTNSEIFYKSDGVSGKITKKHIKMHFFPYYQLKNSPFDVLLPTNLHGY